MTEVAPQSVYEHGRESGSLDLNITPITITQFFEEQADTIDSLLDGLDVDYRPDAQAAFVLDYGGYTTYGLQLISAEENRVFDREIMLIDETSEGVPVGYGFISFFTDGQARVGDTFTCEAYRRQGLGKRRLELMNELVQQSSGQQLHSGMSIEPEAESLWRTLVAEGKAASYRTPKGLTRWRFTK